MEDAWRLGEIVQVHRAPRDLLPGVEVDHILAYGGPALWPSTLGR